MHALVSSVASLNKHQSLQRAVIDTRTQNHASPTKRKASIVQAASVQVDQSKSRSMSYKVYKCRILQQTARNHGC